MARYAISIGVVTLLTLWVAAAGGFALTQVDDPPGREFGKSYQLSYSAGAQGKIRRPRAISALVQAPDGAAVSFTFTTACTRHKGGREKNRTGARNLVASGVVELPLARKKQFGCFVSTAAVLYREEDQGRGPISVQLFATRRK